jgi:Putative antitoxin
LTVASGHLTRLLSTYRILCMSTKTIAVDSRVYERLTAVKRESESFSRTIDRLLIEVGAAHTGRSILQGLVSISPLSEQDSKAFLEIIAEDRASEEWNPSDLR